MKQNSSNGNLLLFFNKLINKLVRFYFISKTSSNINISKSHMFKFSYMFWRIS